MGNTEIIDSLVSKQALDELESLDKGLAKLYVEMEKVLQQANELGVSFSSYGKSLSELIQLIEQSNKVQAKKEATEKELLGLLQEKEKLTQEVLKTEQEHQKVMQEGEKTTQNALKTERESIKTAQAKAAASEKQAKSEKKLEDQLKSAPGSINRMKQ